MKARLIAGTINVYEAEPGWTNVHLDISPRPIWLGALSLAVLPDVVCDIADADQVHATFREGMFDEVRMHHVLEHVPRKAATAALANVAWLLGDGGVLDLEVPDMLRVVKAWLDDDLDDAGMEQWVYGEQLAHHEPGDSHRAGWTETALRAALLEAGFKVRAREETGLALRFVAKRKTRPPE